MLIGDQWFNEDLGEFVGPLKNPDMENTEEKKGNKNGE